MPLYDYGCNDCTKQFELRHSYTDTDIACLYCASINIKKILKFSNIITKGSSSDKGEEASTRVEQEIENKKIELKATKQELTKRANKNDK